LNFLIILRIYRNSDTVGLNLEDGVEEKNTWLHDEPPTYERVAAKTLIERAKIAIKEKIKLIFLFFLWFKF